MKHNIFVSFCSTVIPLFDLKEQVAVFLLIVCFALSCNVAEFSELKEYPVKVKPLGLLQLDDLNTVYQTENEGRLCSTLNEYGYTGFSRILFPNDVNPCSEKPVIRTELADPDTLIEQAKRALVKNKRYTNVSDVEELNLGEALPLYGCTICEGPATNSVPLEWKFTFANQKFNNTEVYGSEISVFVDARGVNRIWGNWFADYYAPGLLDVGYLQAEASVVGMEINTLPINGVDSLIIVEESQIVQASTLQIVPFKNEQNEIELRKTWKVTISLSPSGSNDLYANIDVVDGRLLQIKPANESEEF